MLKKATGLLLGIVILLTPLAALAAAAKPAAPAASAVPAARLLPDNAIAYKTILKTDDYYVAIKTDTIEVAALEDETTVAFTVRWAYVQPAKFARLYPTVKQPFCWRLSRYAMRFDQVTGAAMLMDLETVLFDRTLEPLAQIKGDRKGWRLVLPTDPEYEVFERVVAYLSEQSK